MEFTDEDKKYLLEKVYGGIKQTLDEDLPQIEEAADVTTYVVYKDGKSEGCISRKKAIELLGREVWLSGLARSAFHWTAMRCMKDKPLQVMFDSSRLFR